MEYVEKQSMYPAMAPYVKVIVLEYFTPDVHLLPAILQMMPSKF
jgi:hypothetical protein